MSERRVIEYCDCARSCRAEWWGSFAGAEINAFYEEAPREAEVVEPPPGWSAEDWATYIFELVSTSTEEPLSDADKRFIDFLIDGALNEWLAAV